MDPVDQLRSELDRVLTLLRSTQDDHEVFKQNVQSQSVAFESRLNAEFEARVAQLSIGIGNASSSPATSSSSSSNVRIRPKQPPNFRGNSRDDATDVSTWLHTVNDYFTAGKMFADDERIDYVSTMLEGDAAVWWRFTRLRPDPATIPSTWASFSEALRSNFELINSIEAVRVAFASVRQVTTVQAYAARFRQLMIQLPHVDNADALFRFVNNLKVGVKTQVKIHDPRTLDDAINMAERIDTITYQPSVGRATGTSSFYSGARDMELGAVEEQDEGEPWYEYLEAAHPEMHEQLSAILASRFRPASTRQPPPGRTSFSASPMTPAQKELAVKNALCFSCMKPGHAAHECTLRVGHPKGRAPSS